MKYVRYGNVFFTQDDSGGMKLVEDPETNKGLKAGHIPYTAESITRGLQFGDTGKGNRALTFTPQQQQANTSSLNSGGIESSSSTGTQDLNELFKQKFVESLKNINSSRLPGLQARQAQIQTQMLTAPQPDYSQMTPGAGTQAIDRRGQEYAPALESVTQEIGREKSVGNEQLQALNTLAGLMDKLSPESKQKTTDILNYEYEKLNPEFKQWQTDDVNRKKLASQIETDGGLNPKQVSTFNSIVDKYNKSPLVAANDRTIVLKSVLDPLRKDPSNSSLQISFIYSFIQALDTYQSAVREGEIGLLAGTQGLADQIRNYPDKIAKGSVLSKPVIERYINAANLLTNSIQSAADLKKQQFGAQSEVAGIGDAWREYIQGVSFSQKETPLETRTLKDGSAWEKHKDGKWYPKQ